jgi:hypothetical protein
MLSKEQHVLLSADSLQPMRVYDFKSTPATVSFRLENEQFGEVFKLHPVIKVIQIKVTFIISFETA